VFHRDDCTFGIEDLKITDVTGPNDDVNPKPFDSVGSRLRAQNRISGSFLEHTAVEWILEAEDRFLLEVELVVIPHAGIVVRRVWRRRGGGRGLVCGRQGGYGNACGGKSGTPKKTTS